MRRIAVIALTFLSIAAPALAGPPLLTDDTGTPGDKRWEINIAYTLDKRHNLTTQETPLLDVNYGIGERLQLKYEVPWIVLSERGTRSKTGLGNSSAGIKWRFLDETSEGVDISIFPQLEFNNPTSSADRGVVDKGTDLRLPVELLKKIGPVWIDGEVGYTIRQYEEDQWLYGISSGYVIKEGLSVLGEIHGGSNKTFRKHEVVFNVGTEWDFSKRYGLLASIGRSFKSAASGDPNLLLYLGVQMRF